MNWPRITLLSIATTWFLAALTLLDNHSIPFWFFGSLALLSLVLFLLHLVEGRKWRQWASPVRRRWLIWTLICSGFWLLFIVPWAN